VLFLTLNPQYVRSISIFGYLTKNQLLTYIKDEKKKVRHSITDHIHIQTYKFLISAVKRHSREIQKKGEKMSMPMNIK